MNTAVANVAYTRIESRVHPSCSLFKHLNINILIYTAQGDYVAGTFFACIER